MTFKTHAGWKNLRNFVHPELARDFEGSTKQNALLLRDLLRERVGQLGEDGSIDISSEERLVEALDGKGALTTSCGPIAYLYSRLAQECGVKAPVVSIIWDKPDGEPGEVQGHTLNEVVERNDNRWVIDCHAGNVWQDASNNLTDATTLAKTMLDRVDSWLLHPSSHGHSSASWRYGLLRYTFGFWGFDIDQKPPPRRVGVVTHTIRKQASMPAHTIRWYSHSDDPDLSLTGVGFDSSKARYYWNGKRVSRHKR